MGDWYSFTKFDVNPLAGFLDVFYKRRQRRRTNDERPRHDNSSAHSQIEIKIAKCKAKIEIAK